LESYQRAVYEYWPPSELSARRAARWQLISLLKQTGQSRDQLVGELLQLYGNLPPHSDQRMRVGSMLLEEGADAEAAHVFHDILSDASGRSEAGAYGGLARIAFRAGDFVEARHQYQHVLRIAPDDLATAEALRLTNEIVDIAPELPNISSAERLRRSQNLFNRVRRDLSQCMLPEDDEKQKAGSSDDQAAELQQAAQDLWKNRSVICAGKSIGDPAVETVLPRLGHES
jgi:tetratricopeptide (TPR) repeat protein